MELKNDELKLRPNRLHVKLTQTNQLKNQHFLRVWKIYIHKWNVRIHKWKICIHKWKKRQLPHPRLSSPLSIIPIEISEKREGQSTK